MFVGADDEIRTRDPHLGKVRMTVRTVRLLLRSIPQSPKPSGKSVCSVQFVYRSTIARSKSCEIGDTTPPRQSDSIAAMPCGEVELEPEVVSWLDSLPDGHLSEEQPT